MFLNARPSPSPNGGNDMKIKEIGPYNKCQGHYNLPRSDCSPLDYSIFSMQVRGRQFSEIIFGPEETVSPGSDTKFQFSLQL